MVLLIIAVCFYMCLLATVSFGAWRLTLSLPHGKDCIFGSVPGTAFAARISFFLPLLEEVSAGLALGIHHGSGRRWKDVLGALLCRVLGRRRRKDDGGFVCGWCGAVSHDLRRLDAWRTAAAKGRPARRYFAETCAGVVHTVHRWQRDLLGALEGRSCSSSGTSGIGS